MKQEDIREQFLQFLDENYKKDLAIAVSKGKKSLEIDFGLLDKFNPELTDIVLEKPEEIIQFFEECSEEIDLPKKQKLHVRFKNMPESSKIRIRNIRSEHIGKLLCVDGIVKRASEVRPEVFEIIFECYECGEKISMIQTEKEKTIQYPNNCEKCKSRRGFKILNQKLYDARWIAIEEPFEITTGERPSEIMIYLKEDLTTPKMQNRTDPGNRIRIIGILKEVPRRNTKGGKTRQLEILLDANNIEMVETEWEEIIVSPEEEKFIMELTKDSKVYDKLVASLAPTMYGMETVKLSIVLQLFGGVQHFLKDNTRIRGDIHILLIGDPAVGKSQILKLASNMIPRGRYVSGKGVTGAGLTASVIKDEQFLGGWVLEAGALVLSNNSIISIDEFEKMEKTDQVAMHEAMSLQQVSIAKASIVATLPAKTSVLAGANPKYSRFDPYLPIREQVDLSETLLSRFDVKFALKDVANAEIDAKMVDHVLESRHFKQESAKPFLSPEFLRKYIAFARNTCRPLLTEEAGKLLKNFYVDLRSKSSGEESPIPITLRQYEALIRLAEASAKVQLREKVTVDDAQRAIDIIKFSLRQFGFDPQTGLIDIDRAEGGVSSASRSKIRIVLDVIEELSRDMGKTIPVDELIKRAQEQGVDNVENIIKSMLNEGTLFSPKTGFIQKI
ncbi:MAG: minichromosome maintenance protein MCM [Candidatus Aenigmarchaeota archaeon]|nr:minichromosome maintenance protein MCM [Candidatus Aenigmarchaeota archaeon]